MSPDELRTVSFGVLGAALVVLADAALGFEVSLIALHIIPVLAVSWYASPRWGMFILVLSTAITVLAAMQFAPPVPQPVYRYLDLGSDFLAMLALVLILSRLKQAHRTVERQSRTDTLTGCLNRGSFHAQLEEEVLRQRRYGHAFALLYLDVDNFKQVNDEHGHAAGDALLKEVGRSLRARLRRTDSAGRLGGNEFAVLLPESDAAAARHAAIQIKQELERTARGHRWPVSFSIGAVGFACAPEDADAAIRIADEVMYEAKRMGKDALRVREVVGG